MNIDTEEFIVELFKKGIILDFGNDEKGMALVKVKNEENKTIYGAKGETVEAALAKIFKKVLIKSTILGNKKVGYDTLSLL